MTRMDMKIMEYEEIEVIKQSEGSIIQLIREKDGKQFLIRRVMKGQHPVYLQLKNCHHPCLPRLYEVTITDDTTTIIEEYIEGQPLGYVKLSDRQFRAVVKDLCSVLDFLHGMGIIHRDIKPPNIIYGEDGHIRLIDFDAARVPKDNQEQDTRLLGTRGYAPPEQYGFSQTDVRTDIYSLGITLEQILQSRFQKLRYKRIIQKCTDMDPDRRYQSIRQVRRAFFHGGRNILCGLAVILLAVFLCCYVQREKAAALNFEPAASEKYPNQILWRDYPVREYLGRNINDIMDEIKVPYDEYFDGGDENLCSYREIGIIFCFDDKHKVYLIAIDPALSSFNGEMLNVSKEKLIDIMGAPTLAGWTEKEAENEAYIVDYYDIDTKEGAAFYMLSPEDEANIIYID